MLYESVGIFPWLAVGLNPLLEICCRSLQDLFLRDLLGWAAGAKAFDLFATWRLDSGNYEQVAEAVKEAWELRCSQFGDPAQAPREPALMHSNLSSVHELRATAGYPSATMLLISWTAEWIGRFT